MFDVKKMKRKDKRRRDQTIKDCKREYGNKVPKVIRKKIKWEDAA